MTTAAAAPVLVLGGTGEATELAGRLTSNGHEVVISLAGMTSVPDRLPCRSRTGGFGGVPGLVGELRQGGYRLLVDATHPFAVRMARNAVAAAGLAGIPHVRLLRPPWQPQAGDRWCEVDDLPAAARRLAELGPSRAFLAIGRNELGLFADLTGTHLVVRSVEPPSSPGRATVVLARGPFTVDAELALLRGHRIDVVVTRNSGGRATVAKLDAARRLGLAVIMVRRPECPPGPVVATVAEAVEWAEQRGRDRPPAAGGPVTGAGRSSLPTDESHWWW